MLLILSLPAAQPIYSGPWDANISALTPMTLNELTDPSNAEPGIATLVFFHADWSSACRQSYSAYAELAHRYTNDRTRFCKLDLDTWPHVARQLDIDLAPSSPQLPTVVCFEHGEEQQRLPRTKSKAKGSVRYLDMVHVFELDMRMACSGTQPRSGLPAVAEGAPSTAQGSSATPPASKKQQ